MKRTKIESIGWTSTKPKNTFINLLFSPDLWIGDMEHVGYNDVPASNFVSTSSPCIGDDGLQGVYFSPAVQRVEKGRKSKFIDSFSSRPGSKPLSSAHVNREVSARAIQRLCPTVDLEDQKNAEEVHAGLLLIVTFSRKEYHNIPFFEVIYRHHFKNILYCGRSSCNWPKLSCIYQTASTGEPDPVVDEYMAQYQAQRGSHFSFLPAHSRTGYECLLGAIEMGYDVQGYMIVTHDTLINSWNYKNLDPSTVWHGNEHVKNIR